MRCPFCGHDDTQVKDSRPTEDNAAIRRRRFCPACGSRWTTFERVYLRELTVLKKGGQRAPFDRDKLARSIRIAVRKRPIDDEQVERIVNSIQRRLESFDQSMRQVADEPDGIRYDHRRPIDTAQPSGRGVQGRKQLVGRIGVGTGQPVEQG